MLNLTQDQFIGQAAANSVIPLYEEFACDFLTPVVLFSKLNKEHAFILESIGDSEKFGRYSFIGFDPKYTFRYSGGKTVINDYDSGETSLEGNPLDHLNRLVKKYKPLCYESKSGFLGGAVGYLGYDVISQIENIPMSNPDELHVPDMYFIIPKCVAIFDHLKHTLKLIFNAFITDKNQCKDLYETASQKISEIKKLFNQESPLNVFGIETPISPPDFSSNMNEQDFCRIVEKAKEYIYKGDVFQIVLSQRFKIPYQGTELNLYRALRMINPSPYMFLINFPGFSLVGSSPEILVKEENKKVTIRPIAGTRKRGMDEETDRALEKELLADEKEIAEHVMLVDLARNDIGRVCKGGSVKPDQLLTVERYSHVMHIVSNVTGVLKNDKNAMDLIRACFPAGTVSGSPKIRAMEIIEELENIKRGPYAGTVCHFDFGGNFDSCITIRTILMKEGNAYIQAGAGIVYDSVPAKEYEETLNKARAMMRAIQIANTIKGRNP